MTLPAKYFTFGLAYGMARKLATVGDMRLKTYGAPERPLLWTEQATVVLLGCMASMAYWPVYMASHDIPALECRFRRLQAEEYGYKRPVGPDLVALGILY